MPSLPPQIEIYRQQTSWLVGLSLGAIVGALAFAEKSSALPGAYAALLTAGSLAYLASAATGILGYFYLGSWVGAWDAFHRSPDDQSRKAALATVGSESNKFVRIHRPLLISFFMGCLLSAVLAALLVWAPPAKPETPQLVVSNDGTVWQVGKVREPRLRAWRVRAPGPKRRGSDARPSAP